MRNILIYQKIKAYGINQGKIYFKFCRIRGPKFDGSIRKIIIFLRGFNFCGWLSFKKLTFSRIIRIVVLQHSPIVLEFDLSKYNHYVDCRMSVKIDKTIFMNFTLVFEVSETFDNFQFAKISPREDFGKCVLAKLGAK